MGIPTQQLGNDDVEEVSTELKDRRSSRYDVQSLLRCGIHDIDISECADLKGKAGRTRGRHLRGYNGFSVLLCLKSFSC